MQLADTLIRQNLISTATRLIDSRNYCPDFFEWPTAYHNNHLRKIFPRKVSLQNSLLCNLGYKKLFLEHQALHCIDIGSPQTRREDTEAYLVVSLELAEDAARILQRAMQKKETITLPEPQHLVSVTLRQFQDAVRANEDPLIFFREVARQQKEAKPYPAAPTKKKCAHLTLEP
jgi:hypothetical protein